MKDIIMDNLDTISYDSKCPPDPLPLASMFSVVSWLISYYVITVSLSPHNFSLMEVQRVCVSRFNINNVFLLPQKLCGQFYLHQVFVLGMLLMKLLYTGRFCGNVNSAKLRSCAKTSLTPVTRIHCNIVTGRDE